jgi:Holliday junction resolvase
MTGRRWERKLARLFDDNGWAFVKSPSSGSGRADDQPDLVAAKAAGGLEVPLGVEAKTTGEGALTVEAGEAEQLRGWCSRFGAAPVLAVYWKRRDGGGKDYGGWYFRALPEVRRSPVENKHGGHHLRPRREDRERWARMGDLEAGRLTTPRDGGEK